jgi:hypothetical protein
MELNCEHHDKTLTLTLTGCGRARFAKALEDKEKGSILSGREFRREESREMRERLVSGNL